MIARLADTCGRPRVLGYDLSMSAVNDLPVGTIVQAYDGFVDGEIDEHGFGARLRDVDDNSEVDLVTTFRWTAIPEIQRELVQEGRFFRAQILDRGAEQPMAVRFYFWAPMELSAEEKTRIKQRAEEMLDLLKPGAPDAA